MLIVAPIAWTFVAAYNDHIMIQAQSSIRINCPLQQVYRHIVIDFFENYPKWSPDLIELEQLSDGPVQIGSIGRQIRCDGGRRLESRFHVTLLKPNQEIAFESLTKPYFQVRYAMHPDGSATTVTFFFALQLDLLLKPLGRVLTGMIDRGVERNTLDLRNFIEAQATVSDVLVSNSA